MKVFDKKVGTAIKFPPILKKIQEKLRSMFSIGKKKILALPSTHISDEDTAFKFSMALPGLSRKDVRIELDGGTMIISAIKERSEEYKATYGTRKRLMRNSIRQVFKIPSNADPERISAEMKNGVLKVRMAKKGNTNYKRILKVA